VVEEHQKQQQYQHRNECGNADTTAVFRGGHETEEIVPGVPIIRSNTPRPSPFDAIISSTGYTQKSQRGSSLEVGKGERPHGFPAQAPSAPPLPEELEDDVEAIEDAVGAVARPPSTESQNQILGLSFADPPSTWDQKEQHTDTLPTCEEEMLSSTQVTQRVTTEAHSQRWLIAFALYLVGLLVLLLLLAVVQGIEVTRDTLAGGFTLLGVPWQVMIYGLLGGCISCIVSLSNMRASDPPPFVMITWFTRPFVGSILAIFSYVLLTSGIFMLGGVVDQHPNFFWLAGTCASLCEWRLFYRRRR
jgi:hypothetical protein